MNGAPSKKAGASGLSLRVRLALMLALFALVPSLVVTFLASQRIADSLELMQSPGVTRTLDGAFDISRMSLGRLEVALHATCLAAVDDPEVTAHARNRAQVDTLSLAPLLDRHSIDYVALYARETGGGLQLAGEVRRSASAGAGKAAMPELPRPLAPGVHYDPAGWLVEAVPAGSPGEETPALLAIGYFMGPSFFEQVEDLGRGIGFYRRLDVLKGLYVGGIWVWAVILILAVAVATVLTARWASRSLTSPLVELAEGMRKVARGEEGIIVEPRGSSETRFLTGTFNSMVDQLAAYKRDLAMAERAAAWQDIARIAAHEIRNPLTPIQFAIRRIRDRIKDLPEKEQAPLRESIDSILGEVETLKALASSFSQFAKLPEPSPSAEDMNKLAAETVDLFREERSATFELDLASDLPRAYADTSQMRMVLNNLLKNSVEAMPEGGTVTVRTRHERGHGGSWVLLEVEDTGMGMDTKTLAKATDAYFSTKAKGSGLGLAVVHKIVLQHSGRLKIESDPGSGTRVSIRLPVA